MKCSLSVCVVFFVRVPSLRKLANATDPSLKKHGEDPGIVKLYVVNSSCESNLLVPNNDMNNE